MRSPTNWRLFDLCKCAFVRSSFFSSPLFLFLPLSRLYVQIKYTGNNNGKHSKVCAHNDSVEYKYTKHYILELLSHSQYKWKANEQLETSELHRAIKKKHDFYKRSERSFAHKYNYGHREEANKARTHTQNPAQNWWKKLQNHEYGAKSQKNRNWENERHINE